MGEGAGTGDAEGEVIFCVLGESPRSDPRMWVCEKAQGLHHSKKEKGAFKKRLWHAKTVIFCSDYHQRQSRENCLRRGRGLMRGTGYQGNNTQSDLKQNAVSSLICVKCDHRNGGHNRSREDCGPVAPL